MKYLLIILGLVLIVQSTDKYTCDPSWCPTKCCTKTDICTSESPSAECYRSPQNATCDPDEDCDDDCCIGYACGTASECKWQRDLNKTVGTALGTCYLICLCIAALIVVSIIALIVCMVRGGKKDRRPVETVVIEQEGHMDMGPPNYATN